MDTPHRQGFNIGGCRVVPECHQVVRGDRTIHVRPQVMDLLVYLAERPGQVVGLKDILDGLWPGRIVTDSSVYNLVAELRHALESPGDRQPLIETIPKRGYRLIAPVTELGRSESKQHSAGSSRRTRSGALATIAALIVLSLVTYVASDRSVGNLAPAGGKGSDGQLSNALPHMDQIQSRAYKLVLKGRLLNRLHTADGYQRAQPFFEQALEIDPEYAAAWGGLAKSLRQQFDFGLLTREEALPRIEEILDRGLALDPDNADALAIRGKMLRQPDVEAARVYWRRAIASNPGDPDTYRWLAWSYYDSDPGKFLEYLQQGRRIDPTSPLLNTQLSIALATFGRFEEALSVLSDYHRLDSGNWLTYERSFTLHALSGRPEQAVISFYRAFRLNPTDQALNEFVGFLLDTLAAPEPARIWLDHWKRQPGRDEPGAASRYFQEARLLFEEGYPDQAMAVLASTSDQDPGKAHHLAAFTLRKTGDFLRTRHLIEMDCLDEDGTFTGFDPDGNWQVYIDYALTLQHTGEPERAQELLDTIRNHVQSWQADGAVLGPYLIELNAILATLEAVDGNPQAALAALQQAAHDGFTCPSCLRRFPHFDNLRDDPALESLTVEMEARQAQWRQRLLAANLLLTPEQVLASEDSDFDPFEQEQRPE